MILAGNTARVGVIALGEPALSAKADDLSWTSKVLGRR